MAAQDAIPVDTTIAFQDGTKQRIRTVLRVIRMDGDRHGHRKVA